MAAVISGITPTVIGIAPTPGPIIASPAPSVVPPGIVPAPSPTVVWGVPAIAPIGIGPAVQPPKAVQSAPCPTVVIYIDAYARGVVPPAWISVIVVVIGQVIGLLAVGNGVIAPLAGITVDIGEDLIVQYFLDLIGPLPEVVAVMVVFLLLYLDPIGISPFHADHFVSAGIDAVTVIGGLLVTAT